MKNFLIVEKDLGFVTWLSGALIAAHQQPVPAASVSDAIVLASDPTTSIDVLVINSALPDADKLIAMLRRSKARLKVIALEAKGKVRLPRVNVWRPKPSPADESAKQELLKVVNPVHRRAA